MQKYIFFDEFQFFFAESKKVCTFANRNRKEKRFQELYNKLKKGEMPEWSIGAVSKTVDPFWGS